MRHHLLYISAFESDFIGITSFQIYKDAEKQVSLYYPYFTNEAQVGEVTYLRLSALSWMNLSFFLLCSHIIVCKKKIIIHCLYYYYYSLPSI